MIKLILILILASIVITLLFLIHIKISTYKYKRYNETEEDFERMFRKDIEVLKANMNKYELSDEFKKKLKQILKEEYNKKV